MADDAGAGVATISIKFTSSDKAAGQVSISLQSTIGSLKEAIRSQFEMEPKRLIFQGRILSKDDQTLEACKLKDGLAVVVQATPATAKSTSATSTASSPAAPSPAGSASQPPSADATASARQAMAQALAGGLGGAATRGGAAGASPVGQAVATVRGQTAGVARECLTTLTKVIDNILTHPMEEKYRKIKRSNAGFRRKVGGVPGGEACMRALGFVEADGDQGSWVLQPSAAAWNVLTAGRVQIQSALATLPVSGATTAQSGSSGASSSAGFAAGLGEFPPPGAFPGGFGGAGGMGGGMGAGLGGGMPDMATVQRMMQDPATMQNMMNDPSVQAMMNTNPQMAGAMRQIASNPGMMSQAFNAMQSNPARMAQAQQMMQDPATLQRVSQMNLDGAFQAGVGAGANAGQPPAGGFGGQTFTTPPPAPAPVPATGSAESEGGGGDEEGEQGMTEDELIAEAIRRSMED